MNFLIQGDKVSLNTFRRVLSKLSKLFPSALVISFPFDKNHDLRPIYMVSSYDFVLKDLLYLIKIFIIFSLSLETFLLFGGFYI